MNEVIAQQVIRRKLLDHQLPRGRTTPLWNASGQERVCDGCDEKIDPQDKAVWGIAVRDWGVLYLHATCYELWEAERLTLGPDIFNA
jgi:hypothetical protein